MSGLTAHFLFGSFSPRKLAARQGGFGGPKGRFRGLPPLLPRAAGGQDGHPRMVGNPRGWKQMAVALETIREAAERVARTHGLEVVDLEFGGSAKDRILRVYLEKDAAGRTKLKEQIAQGGEELPGALREGTLSPEQFSGITHGDCEEFSRDFGVLLDVEDLVPGGEYTLEASSPGLDRKLSKVEDFERFAGSLVKVQTFEPIRGNRHWQGRLTEVRSQVSEARPGVPTIVVDLGAVKQNSKSRKAGGATVEIAWSNVEKAQLVPEI